LKCNRRLPAVAVAVGKWKSLFDFQARGASVFSTAFSPPSSEGCFLLLLRTQATIGQSIDPLQFALDGPGQLKRVQASSESLPSAYLLAIGLRAGLHSLERGSRPVLDPPHLGTHTHLLEQLHGRKKQVQPQPRLCVLAAFSRRSICRALIFCNCFSTPCCSESVCGSRASSPAREP
jgi:hypothetical protein